MICCDAPAKAFLMRVKGHSGFSCSRCKHEGVYMNNRVCFPYSDVNSIERTHDDYVLMNDEEYHTSTISCLVLIPDINTIKIFSMDYMHLTYLGVIKKLINLWLNKGPVNTRLPSWKCKQLTNYLLEIKPYITNNFSQSYTRSESMESH